MAEAFGDPAEAALLPAEREYVVRAVEKRRREFTTARWCARRALARLGLPPVAIPRGERGAPVWPAGVVGSMTHCDGYRAAALARSGDVISIGVDAEPHAPLPDGVLETVTLPEERRLLADVTASDPTVCWDRLLFCAKEATYKTWFPLTRRWLGFDEASVSLDPVAGTFVARLLVPGPVVGGEKVDSFPGRWLVDDGLIAAAIVLSRTATGRRQPGR